MKFSFTILCSCFFMAFMSYGVQLMAGTDNRAAFSPADYTDSLVINEINYNSAATFDPGDWVELYNPQAHALDISNWVFKDEVDTHAFIFSQGTQIPANGFIVVAFDLTTFHTLFPDVTNYVGPMGFGLSGSGELLRVYDNNEALVDTVHYDDAAPWPTGADGNGASLELLSPSLNNALGENWKDSGNPPHGTPGEANVINLGISPAAAAETLSLSIFPNPVQTTAFIKINSKVLNDEGTLNVYNFAGQMVRHIELITGNLVEIDRNGLVSGCYLVRFTNKAGTLIATGKLVVD